MAFEKSSFSILAVRILPGCKDHLKKILKGEWYLLNSWYVLKDGRLTKRDDASLERSLYGENVSISAIVGKNGSGKSSLMELIFRLVNNLNFCMMQGSTTAAAWPPMFIEGLRSELYFESQGELGRLSCKDFEVEFQWGNEETLTFHAVHLQGRHDDNSLKRMAYITRHFCFSLVSNYAMMSLNPGDYWRDVAYAVGRYGKKGNWLDCVYNKNDGYTAALGIEPYKGEGIINLYTQKKLCKARLVGMLIETGKRGEELFDGYSYNSIELRIDKEFMFKQGNDPNVDYQHGGNHLNMELPNLLKNRFSFAAVILDEYGYAELNKEDPVVMIAAAYLVYKTLHVAEIYPKYNKYRRVGKTRYFARDTRAFDKHIADDMVSRGANLDNLMFSEMDLRSLVDEIGKDKSHIALKIRQTLHFLLEVKHHYEKEDEAWMCPEIKSYEQYMELFDNRREKYKHIYDNIDSIMDYFPPPFFESSIYLNRRKQARGIKKRQEKAEKIPYETISTGEQQFIQTTASLLYHIRNVVSVTDMERASKYYNINLFIDEIEACFHPEYQQRFIKLFLGMLNAQKLTERCNVNVVIATHSPFILSDIPKQNVLYLDNGSIAEETKQMVNPFCGNVCDMLRHSFFLDKGFMGEWAKDMVNDLILFLRRQGNEKEYMEVQPYRSWTKETAKAFINMIGEPILKGSLMNKFAEVFSDELDSLVAWHRSEIARLTKKGQG